MQDRKFTLIERCFLVGVPLLWSLLLLFHPGGETNDFFPVVTDDVTRWLAVHVGTMIFVPLMAAVVFLLLRGLGGRAASIARVSILVYAVAYTAWEVLVGIGTGILVNDINGLAGDQAAAGIELVERYNESSLLLAMLVVGGLGLSVGLLAAGQALISEGGAPRSVLVLLALSILAIGFHEPPVGPVGLALFIAAVLIATRSGAPSGAAGLSSTTARPPRRTPA